MNGNGNARARSRSEAQRIQDAEAFELQGLISEDEDEAGNSSSKKTAAEETGANGRAHE